MFEEPIVRRTLKIWDCWRDKSKGVMVASFNELLFVGKAMLGISITEPIKVFLDCDGTEVENDEYYNTLKDDTVLMLLREGEAWHPRSTETVQNALKAIPKMVREILKSYKIKDVYPSHKVIWVNGTFTAVMNWKLATETNFGANLPETLGQRYSRHIDVFSPDGNEGRYIASGLDTPPRVGTPRIVLPAEVPGTSSRPFGSTGSPLALAPAPAPAAAHSSPPGTSASIPINKPLKVDCSTKYLSHYSEWSAPDQTTSMNKRLPTSPLHNRQKIPTMRSSASQSMISGVDPIEGSPQRSPFAVQSTSRGVHPLRVSPQPRLTLGQPISRSVDGLSDSQATLSDVDSMGCSSQPHLYITTLNDVSPMKLGPQLRLSASQSHLSGVKPTEDSLKKSHLSLSLSMPSDLNPIRRSCMKKPHSQPRIKGYHVRFIDPVPEPDENEIIVLEEDVQGFNKSLLLTEKVMQNQETCLDVSDVANILKRLFTKIKDVWGLDKVRKRDGHYAWRIEGKMRDEIWEDEILFYDENCYIITDFAECHF